MKNLAYILILVFFSLFLEFVVRGSFALTREFEDWFFLFLIYFAYYKILEDLIVRYKLKDFQLLYLVIFLSIVIETWITGSAFKEAIFLNFSPMALLIPTVLWVSLQSFLALYLANRIRTKRAGTMEKFGWILSVGIFLFVAFGANLARGGLPGKPGGYLALSILAVVLVVILRKSVKKTRGSELMPFRKSKLMDGLVLGYFLVGLVGFFWLSEPYGEFSAETMQNGYMKAPAYGMILYGVLVLVILLVYRLARKRALVV